MHSHATVVNQTALASLVARPRRIWLQWTTCTWTVRAVASLNTARMPDAMYVALGIADEVEMYGLKGSKKKKGKKLDEDFIVRSPALIYVLTGGRSLTLLVLARAQAYHP